MPFTGDTFSKLFAWLIDPVRNEKIFNARLDAEFGGVATGLSAVAARATLLEASVTKIESKPTRIYLNANQTGITNSTWTKINFDTVDYDPGSQADVVTNHRITPNTPGTYIASAAIDMALTAAVNGGCYQAIAKNGTRVAASGTALPGGLAEIFGPVTWLGPINGTTDFVEAQCFMTTTGGNGISQAGSAITYLQVQRVGP